MLEIKEVASMTRQIINPKNNSPVIGGIMDIVIGSNLITSNDSLLSETTVKNILPKITNQDKELPQPIKINEYGERFWRGKDIMSMLIPNINFHKKGKDEPVHIVNGKIKSGVFDKGIVGAAGNGLVHMIVNDMGEQEATNFLNDLSPFVCEYLKMKGFSVGYGDTLTSNEIYSEIKDIVSTVKADVNSYIKMIYEKKSKITKQDFESKIFNKLNKARDDAGKIVMNTIDTSNNFFAMVNSKSKGNFINISQIMSIVGQQNSSYKGESGRIPFMDGNRTLPFYRNYDISPEARGFVEHSYLEGLSPNEFFFHSQSGREGIIDTACKTSETGLTV